MHKQWQTPQQAASSSHSAQNDPTDTPFHAILAYYVPNIKTRKPVHGKVHCHKLA